MIDLQNTTPTSGSTIQQIQVDRPILYDRANIVTKSGTGPLTSGSEKYFPEGTLKITIRSVGDTILKFDIARDINGGGGTSQKVDIFNLSGFTDISFVIKNDSKEVDIPVTAELGIDSVNLKQGKITFKIPESRYQEIKSIWSQGNKMFYITAKSAGSRFSIYSGLYEVSDSPQQQQQLEQTSQQISNNPTSTASGQTATAAGTISLDPAVSAPSTAVDTGGTTAEVPGKVPATEQAPALKPTEIKDYLDKLNKLQ
jgi:hypothetical protein